MTTGANKCPNCAYDLTEVVKQAISARCSEAAKAKRGRPATDKQRAANVMNFQNRRGARYAVEMWPGGRREFHVFPDHYSRETWLRNDEPTHKAAVPSHDSELRKALRRGDFTDHHEEAE